MFYCLLKETTFSFVDIFVIVDFLFIYALISTVYFLQQFFRYLKALDSWKLYSVCLSHSCFRVNALKTIYFSTNVILVPSYKSCFVSLSLSSVPDSSAFPLRFLLTSSGELRKQLPFPLLDSWILNWETRQRVGGGIFFFFLTDKDKVGG